MVPVGDYELALHKANIIKEGKDITLIGWGA
jgi:2-oxoisovalerate dehydrogenase E1 component beta subunit